MAEPDVGARPTGGALPRRAVLSGGALAAAVIAAKIASDTKSAYAADGAPILAGQENSATRATTLQASGTRGGMFALEVTGGFNSGGAVFGQGFGAPSVGLLGLAPGATVDDPNQPIVNSAGVYGIGENSPGVLGSSAFGAGVKGTGSPGVLGMALMGPGLHGVAGNAYLDPNEPLAPNAGVFGNSEQYPAIYGSSLAAPGVIGRSMNDSGVFGTYGTIETLDPNDISPQSGVFGLASTGAGVTGVSVNGAGLRGTARVDSQPGVHARNAVPGGLALSVEGRCVFSTGGIATIPKKARSRVVFTSAIRPDALVLVTLTSDPGARSVRWVEYLPDGFVVHLSGKATQNMTFNWLVLGFG